MTAQAAMCVEALECLNVRDFPSLEAHLHDDVVLDYPGMPLVKGRRLVVRFLKTVRSNFGSLDFSVRHAFADGPHTVVVWSNAGDRSDGLKYENDGVTVFEVRDGKLLSISDYFKRHEHV